MTCEEALKKLYDIIDEEASRTDVERVREHLESCKSCMSRYQFEKMFKHFIIEKSSSQQTHSRLRENILDHIDKFSPAPTGRFRKPFRFGAVVFSAAAVLVICIVAAFTAAKFYRHKALVLPYEKVHLAAYSAGEIKDSGVMETSKALTFFSNDLHLSLDTNVDYLSLKSACCCDVHANHFAHLQLIHENNHISLLAGKKSGVNLPDFEKIKVNGFEYYRHICNECQMIYWYLNDAIVIAITKNHDVSLDQMLSVVKTI